MSVFKRIGAIVLTLTLMVPLAACGVTADGEGKEYDPADVTTSVTEDVQWDFLLGQAQTHPRYTGIHKMIENVEKRTGGHFKINLYSAGEVPYSGTDVVQVVTDNIFQMSDGIVSNIGGISSVANIPTFPFLCSDWDSFKKLADTIYPYFEEEIAKNNIYTLSFFSDPMQYLFGAGEAPTSWEDMKGRSMRAQNGYNQGFASAVGANSISVTVNEIPTAISRGVVDSFATSSLSTYSGGLYEYIDYTMAMPFSTMGSFIMVNQDAWDALPEDYQKILKEEAVAMSDEYWNGFVEEQDKQAMTSIEAAGVKTYSDNVELINTGREIVEPYYQKWAAEAGTYCEEALAAVYKELGYE